jgi:hypothetical protein
MGYRLRAFSPVFWLLSLFLLLPAMASAASFRLTSDTILRAFESNTRGGDDLALPIYEYLQADIGQQGDLPLTFHLYGWGRVDLTDSDYYDAFYGGDQTAGELLYGYAEYRHPDTTLVARLGRQYVFSGVTNESIDGLRLDTGITPWFSLTAFGGWPVGLETTEGRDGDSLFGGRIAHHQRNLYEIGLSWQGTQNDGDNEEEFLGIDFVLFLPAGVNVSGFSSRDLEGDGWAEHRYEVNFELGPLQLRPFFERYQYDNYFNTGANTGGPFRFLDELDETLTVFGTDVLSEWKNWELGVKGKYYDYQERDDSSGFVSGVAIRNLEGLSQVGGELGRMEGDTAENDYLLARTFVYWDQIPADRIFEFLTGDLVYVFYDEDIHGEDDSLFISVGAGRWFLEKRLELRIAGDYSFDPYYDDDLRGWLLARYTFDR